MQIDYSKAKDGSKTFSANGVFFHSTYSPQKEAERFADSIQTPYTPKLVFLIEPGLAYCHPFIKEKFGAKTVCLRLFDQKLEDEDSWDYVINPLETPNLSQKLIDTFGEENLIASTIAIWKPACNLFNEQINTVIAEYKNTLEKCKTLIVTRQFFEKKWLMNSCTFFSHAKNICSNKIITTLPVAVCASGPSLKPCLPVLKEKQNSVFIICLSSATSVLLKNNIIPDLVLTTDGGYWAGQHLKALYKHPELLNAAPYEAFIPKKLLKQNPLLVLNYNDASSFICNQIIQKTELPFMNALRNPTVSGTALYFAKAITDNSIYFCGLDMAGAKGFSHTQPNELEANNSLNDNRIHPKATRLAGGSFSSQSLDIYRDWFCSQKGMEKVFRVIDNEYKQNDLGQIKDISSKDFDKAVSSNLQKSFEIQTVANNCNKVALLDFVCNELSLEKWQKQIFPADFISQNKKRLEEKVQDLTAKIRRLKDE